MGNNSLAAELLQKKWLALLRKLAIVPRSERLQENTEIIYCNSSDAT